MHLHISTNQSITTALLLSLLFSTTTPSTTVTLTHFPTSSSLIAVFHSRWVGIFFATSLLCLVIKAPFHVYVYTTRAWKSREKGDRTLSFSTVILLLFNQGRFVDIVYFFLLLAFTNSSRPQWLVVYFFCKNSCCNRSW